MYSRSVVFAKRFVVHAIQTFSWHNAAINKRDVYYSRSVTGMLSSRYTATDPYMSNEERFHRKDISIKTSTWQSKFTTSENKTLKRYESEFERTLSSVLLIIASCEIMRNQSMPISIGRCSCGRYSYFLKWNALQLNNLPCYSQNRSSRTVLTPDNGTVIAKLTGTVHDGLLSQSASIAKATRCANVVTSASLTDTFNHAEFTACWYE